MKKKEEPTGALKNLKKKEEPTGALKNLKKKNPQSEEFEEERRTAGREETVGRRSH